MMDVNVSLANPNVYLYNQIFFLYTLYINNQNFYLDLNTKQIVFRIKD